MKPRGLVACLIILWFCLPADLLAQPKPGPTSLSPCLPLPQLNLSPEQEGALAAIERSFQGQLSSLRNGLLMKRLEFQAALANPQVDEQVIKSKAEEFRRQWTQCQQTTTDYYLQIRSVLTPEQRQKWFSAANRCFPKNFDR